MKSSGYLAYRGLSESSAWSQGCIMGTLAHKEKTELQVTLKDCITLLITLEKLGFLPSWNQILPLTALNILLNNKPG